MKARGLVGHREVHGRSPRRPLALVALLTALLAASAAVAASAPAVPVKVDWLTFAGNNSREGWNPAESIIGRGNVHRLRQAWSVKIGGLMNTQPLYAAGVPVRVRVGHGRIVVKDLVIAASDKGRVAAVDAATGKKVWQRRFASLHLSSCGDLPYYGITGTPVIDRATNSLYLVDGKGVLEHLNLSNGRTRHHRKILSDPSDEHDWSALTLFHGRIYAELASYCDNPPYHGQVDPISTRTGRITRWFVTGLPGPNGGGIWSWGGVSVDPSGRAIYTATGNSIGSSDHLGYAERVVRLTPKLRVVASNYPGLPQIGDADFGATPMLYRAPGCPPQLAVGNKHGTFFVYDRDNIGRGPVQRIGLGGSSNGSQALIGVAAYLPTERTVYVTNPSRRGGFGAGMLAFQVTGNCRLALRWQAAGPGGATSSPTIADGVVFYGTGGSGRVIALDARSGKRLWTSRRMRQVWGPPTVVNGAVYVTSFDGRLRAFTVR